MAHSPPDSDTADTGTDPATTVPPFLADLLDERDCRALTETMFLAEEAPDLYRVRTASDGDYRVDIREPACTCPDFQYREARCKHIRRMQLERGDRDAGEISASVERALARVDERLAELASRRSELVALRSAAERFDSR